MKLKTLLIGITILTLSLCGCGGTNNSGQQPDPIEPPIEEKYYTITWKNYDGSVLEIDKDVKENIIPTYNSKTPTKPEDNKYTYSWSGWTPNVVKATKDATYTATFSSSEKGPTKKVVSAHTLKDNNPPIDVNAKGEQVSKETWDQFRNASQDKFEGNYNYTYKAYSGGYQTIEMFTKNGYYMHSSAGKLYYERKSGNNFYQYISTKEGYLREETTLDIKDKYTYRIHHEIYVHMFDYEEYEYDDYDGCYWYRTFSFGAAVKFVNGYITYLHYAMGISGIFDIDLCFETSIDIPESYYYE